MGTEDIAALRSYAPNAAVIATHMDAVGHATLSRDGLRAFITDNKLNKDFYIPADGETLEFNMTKKQKKLLQRITAAAILFAAGMLLSLFAEVPAYIIFALFGISYIIIGWDIIWKAFCNSLTKTF